MLHDIPLPKNNEYSKYLETFRRGAEGEQPLDEHAIQAWWRCHQQRINFVYREIVNAPEFILPCSLTNLVLTACNITDGALSHCLKRLTALSDLHLEAIMTLTSLPSEHVMRQLKSLKALTIIHCWCLRSLGFLQGLVSLEILVVTFCPCLDIKHTRDDTTFPTSLQCLSLHYCVIPDGLFTCDMPYLYQLEVGTCRGSKFLSIGMLTSLRNLLLRNCPDLFKVEGLQFLSSLEYLVLINLPNLQAGSLLETPVGLRWYRLEISSLEMLKVLSSNNAFADVKRLFIQNCQEETFTFEGLSHIPSLRQLTFVDCKIKVLPNSLMVLSSLEYLGFIDCPEISSMPQLPESITDIMIEKCPVLREICRAFDGPDWPKIAHIPYKYFKD
ncbi:hypothetical protein LUZ60_009807 [Juncus effusus]|nr:hypothetical protein LUZ60_009807 [Juncus effusus]